jgi:hypothetical protein
MIDIDFMLPRPTEDELNLGMREEYYHRIIEMNLDKKYKINQVQINNWILHNYNSVFLLNEELTLTEFKKLR